MIFFFVEGLWKGQAYLLSEALPAVLSLALGILSLKGMSLLKGVLAMANSLKQGGTSMQLQLQGDRWTLLSADYVFLLVPILMLYTDCRARKMALQLQMSPLKKVPPLMRHHVLLTTMQPSRQSCQSCQIKLVQHLSLSLSKVKSYSHSNNSRIVQDAFMHGCNCS